MAYNEQLAAADSALQWLESASDDELLDALENCDGAIAYAVDPNFSNYKIFDTTPK